MLAIIGDQFDDCRGKPEDNPKAKLKSEDGGEGAEWPEICGCTISVRQSEDIITVWNRLDGDPKLREQIRYVSSWNLVKFSLTRWIEIHYGRYSTCLHRQSWSINPTMVNQLVCSPPRHSLTNCCVVQTLCKTSRVSGERWRLQFLDALRTRLGARLRLDAGWGICVQCVDIAIAKMLFWNAVRRCAHLCLESRVTSLLNIIHNVDSRYPYAEIHCLEVCQPYITPRKESFSSSSLFEPNVANKNNGNSEQI